MFAEPCKRNHWRMLYGEVKTGAGNVSAFLHLKLLPDNIHQSCGVLAIAAIGTNAKAKDIDATSLRVSIVTLLFHYFFLQFNGYNVPAYLLKQNFVVLPFVLQALLCQSFKLPINASHETGATRWHSIATISAYTRISACAWES